MMGSRNSVCSGSNYFFYRNKTLVSGGTYGKKTYYFNDPGRLRRKPGAGA